MKNAISSALLLSLNEMIWNVLLLRDCLQSRYCEGRESYQFDWVDKVTQEHEEYVKEVPGQRKVEGGKEAKV